MFDALHRSYEKVFFYNAPRARSKKVRKYEHIDITREFEILTQRRHEAKRDKLEQLYAKHDEKLSQMTSLTAQPNKVEHVATFSDGEEVEQQRQLQV